MDEGNFSQDGSDSPSKHSIRGGEQTDYRRPLLRAVDPDSFSDRFDVKKLFSGIYRHTTAILVFALIFGILSIKYTYDALKLYKAEAVIIYQEEKATINEGSYTLGTMSLATALDMIKLPINFQAVKSILGLNIPADALNSMVSAVKPRNNSNLIWIIAINDNPHLAVDVVNTLAKVVVKNSQEFNQKQLLGALQGYKEQMDFVAQRLNAEAKEVESFKEKNKYFEMTADYTGLVSQMKDAKKRLSDATILYNSLLVEYENLKREVSNLPDEVPLPPNLAREARGSPLQSRITALQTALAEAHAKYTKDNPKIKQLEEEIANLYAQSKTASSREDTSNELFERNDLKTKLEVELMRMQGKVRAAQKTKQDTGATVAKLEKEMVDLPSQQTYFSKLLDAKKATEDQLKQLNDAVETTQIMLNVPKGSLELYQMAEEAVPAKDALWVKLLPLFGTLFGLGSGILWALFMETIDNKYRTAGEINRRYTIPCIATIPIMHFTSKKDAYNKTVFYVRGIVERINLVKKRTSQEEKSFSIAFTGAQREAGKSSLSYFTALYYSQHRRRKVLLLDCDYHPNRYIESIPKKFLEDYLHDNATVDEIIEHEDFDIIKVGSLEPAMKELIKSERMQSLLKHLKSEYDVIVFDVPGIIEDPYSINLLELADTILLVFNSSKTTKYIIDEAMSTLEEYNIQPTGIILNQILPLYISDHLIKIEMKKHEGGLFKRFFFRRG